MSVANFYIYRHVRPDTNQVFYIGKGNNADKRVKRYARAFNSGLRRNEHWKRIVKINNGVFQVDILYECSSEEVANKKEVEFINIYKRRDHGGTLCNLTDGGEGARGVIMSPEIRLKHAEYYKVSTCTFQSKKVINVLTKQTYRSLKEVTRLMGYSSGILAKYLCGEISNKTPFVFYKDYVKLGEKECLGKINQPEKYSERSRRKVIDIVTKQIHPSVKAAAKSAGVTHAFMVKMLKGWYKNKTNLRYYDGL